MAEQGAYPKWIRDVMLLLPIREQFILTGNIRDHVHCGEDRGQPRLLPLLDALWDALATRAYLGLLAWDPVAGLRLHAAEREHVALLSRLAGTDLSSPEPMSLAALGRLIRRVAVPDREDTVAVGLVIDYASRLRSDGQTSDEVRQLCVAAEKAAIDARLVPRQGGSAMGPLFNPVFWLANRANDLPFWLTVDNERIRHVPVPLPDADTRRQIAGALYSHLDQQDVERAVFAAALARLTHNVSVNGLLDIVRLAHRHAIAASDISDAVESYRVGDLSMSSPWRGAELRNAVRAAEATLQTRVMGQDKAVTRVLDTLKRTSIGLTGAQAGGGATRPRGVLFFAGPTGVGKTEMAKAIAEVVFGDEAAYLRFDMSEFSAEHSGDRLIGAPPGYVGFDQGGELTNAMRERPFRVLLFDEIEKAHDRILDKFLQVLEDGRLTDGRGETVYFSEALIIFTSNAGISRERADGSVEMLVSPEDTPEAFERKVMEGIRHYFRHELRRPELLNRFGENIVLFGFISEQVSARIFDVMVANVASRILEEHEVNLVLEQRVREALLDVCARHDLQNGGRGIGAKLESAFINPLARLMFDRGVARGSTLRVTGVRQCDGVYELDCDH